MPLPAPLKVDVYRVFVSSGSDADVLRDRLESICAVANEVLKFQRQRSRIEVERWEHTPARRVETDRVNEEFVRLALSCHLVVALLFDEIRPGTLEELEAVLEAGDIDVAVFCFDSGQTRTRQMRDFLAQWRDTIRYAEVGRPEDDQAWLELVRAVMNLMIRTIPTAPDSPEPEYP